MPSIDFYAKRLVQHSPLPGRFRLAMLGRPQRLIRAGKLSDALQVAGPDETPIDAWVIRSSLPAGEPHPGTVFLIHGLWDSKAYLFPAARQLAESGYDVAMADLRCHGNSGGRFTTFGAIEKFDCLAVLRTLRERSLVRGPLHVVGFSVGGGVAVQLAALCNNQPDPLLRCEGVVAMAPVACARWIMRRMMAVLAPLMRPARVEEVINRAGELAGFDVDEASAIAAAPNLHCPLVVAHGRCDATVPASHGRAVFAAAREPKRFVSVPWAGHNSLMLGRGRWFAQQLRQLAKTVNP